MKCVKIKVSFFQFSLFTLFFIAFFIEAKAQCPNIIPTTDQQRLIDTMALYPNCEHYAKGLGINGALTDLTPLSSLKSVKYISVVRDSTLSTLHGLHNITNVTDFVTVYQSPYITNLDGLAALQSVGATVKVSQMHALQNLAGLSNLKDVGGDLEISQMDELLKVDGFDNLEDVGGDLLISGFDKVVVVNGIQKLIRIGGDLRIIGNEVLSVVDALNGLNLIEGNFSTDFNPLLDTIDGFNTLSVVNGNVSIHLSSEGYLVLDALQTVGQSIFMDKANSVSLENLTTVGANFYLPDALETLTGFNKLMSVQGEFNIVRSSLEQFPDFASLEFIGGNMYITDNSSLYSLNGFNALKTVEGKLWIYGNKPLLTEIKGFNSLETVGDNFNIRDNEALRTICGFESLKTVGGDFDIWFNDLLTDCDVVCPLLQSDDIGGDVHISFNSGPCNFESTLREFCDQPFTRMTLIDANPELLSSFLFEVDNVREVDAESLISNTTLLREAIAADGVTEVVLIAEFKEEGVVNFEIETVPLEMPWNTPTIEVDGRYYALAIFKAPDVFPELLQEAHVAGVPSRALQEIHIFHSGEVEVTEATDEITIVRPPVVLVHGTYSSPVAWTDKSEEMSMSEMLEDAGFNVFIVDYESSNGSSSVWSSSFETNAQVLWENEGGIRDALNYYRNTELSAVTQVDVVGHSLGGVLPRVYASEYYNDEYMRKENFMEGDINRLISLAGTHFGSHLGELQQYLEDATVFETGLLGWMANGAALSLAWLNGRAASEAVVDQLPPPSAESALANIGETEIPSHAITLSVPKGQLKDPVHDPNEEYYNLYSYMSLLFYYNATFTESYLDKKLELCDLGVKANSTKAGVMPSALYPHLSEEEIFKGMFIDAIDVEGKLFEILDGEWEMPSDIEIFKYVTAEVGMSDWDPMIDIFVAGADPYGVALDLFVDYITPEPPAKPERPDDLIEAVRFMVFNNDDNDGTVRVESQSGELEKECEDCVTNLENVLHGPAPQYSVVQNTIADLLKGGMDNFNETGFPAVDHVQTLYYPPTNIDPTESKDSRSNAICQSGMVRSHAEAFAKVADQQNTVIIVRPVNPDATLLIEEGAATKEMDVKPKSSNWGPQKGYLPVNQRYSKLWEIYTGNERDEIIDEYNQKAKENLLSGLTVKRQLTIKACNTEYFVRVDSTFYLGELDGNAKDEVVLVPVMNPSMVCLWGDTFDKDKPILADDCQEITDFNRLGPFEVMATPRETEPDGNKKFLTADYDLLMMGFYKGENNPYNPPGNVPFKDGVGQITPEQEVLIAALNQAVKTTGYTGGNVSHHGPENQFSKSPYIDYPLTVFLPGDKNRIGDGQIQTINMGEKGFRDADLKMLVNRMRKEGYDLYDNTQAPGWKWTWSQDLDGFELEDSPLLNDYVEQLPVRNCNSKTGSNATQSAECPHPVASYGIPVQAPSEASPGRSLIALSPNPVFSSEIAITTWSPNERSVRWKVIDAIGSVRLAGKMTLAKGESIGQINISILEPGMYHFIMSDGATKTWIRM